MKKIYVLFFGLQFFACGKRYIQLPFNGYGCNIGSKNKGLSLQTSCAVNILPQAKLEAIFRKLDKVFVKHN